MCYSEEIGNAMGPVLCVTVGTLHTATVMGGTGHGASGTSPSGVCLSTPLKSNSSPEPESSQKLLGAALQPAIQGGPGCCLSCLPLPWAIEEAG